jgi:type VI secretion system secreted protein Hcp
MAVDMFMKLDPLKGESKDKVHKEEIDVLAWSWGASNSGTAHYGTGAGAGKASIQDLSFTKWVDNSTPDLMKSCIKGTHIDKAILTVRKAGDNPLEYIVITMTDVMVTSLSTGGSGGEDRLTENVTLNFAEFKLVYTNQAKDGSAGAAPEVAYNIAENADA